MFLEDADMTCLRQGDILEGIFFPRLDSREVVLLGKVSAGHLQSAAPSLDAVTSVHRDDPAWLTAQLPVRRSFCCVISQCCDLEPRNGRILMPAFALARLIALPKRILADPQRLTSLRANKDPRESRDPGYINFFYIPPHERLNQKEWVVDFNQTISIPGSEFPSILKNKVLQMENEWRVKFKIKLAACLARLTEEERGAGLENPWIEKQEPMKFPD
jgi:hypothetical protein